MGANGGAAAALDRLGVPLGVERRLRARLEGMAGAARR